MAKTVSKEKIIDSRQYRPSDIRRLDTLSGNECAAPGCTRQLIARDGLSIVSKICHIEAANSNGPRYNSSMTNEQRRHYSNLILLCDECHTIIDNMQNVSEYPVSLLKEWKKNHEEKMQLNILSKKTLLVSVIDAIADSSFGDDCNTDSDSTSIFNINDKLNHNNIIRYRHLIEDYKIYYTKLTMIYNELEYAGSFKKESLLRNIRQIYLKIKGKYAVTEGMYIDEIRVHADDIIEDIENQLLEACDARTLLDDGDISFGISLIMVDAFMRCKILEEPPK